MPELPEVEAARRMLDRLLTGKKIVRVEIPPDDIVLKGAPPEALIARIEGAKVKAVKRKGKYFWLDLGERGILGAHLGMSGAILDVSGGQREAVSYKQNKGHKFDDEGRPKYLKLLLEANDGSIAVLADPRRLGRIWMSDSEEADKSIQALGPDALNSLPGPEELAEKLKKRNLPIKALLLNQSFLSGIGNWIADEVLYQARMAPKRIASSLTRKEAGNLHKAIHDVIAISTKANADYTKFPEDWLFHVRWGGSRGGDVINGEQIIRETVGGRTTAWVPTRQS